MKFDCPKSETGVLCGICEKNSVCPLLSSSSQRFLLSAERTPFYSEREFEYPKSKISREKYELCMRVSEDFKLTKASTRDLIYYFSKFKAPYPISRTNLPNRKNERMERICAVTAIVLLERDSLPIYRNNEGDYNRAYNLYMLNFPKIYKWVKTEIVRITNESFPKLWNFFSEDERDKFTGSRGQLVLCSK